MSGNLFIYYREGDPQAVVAPYVFGVVGEDSADRSTYRLWEELKGPDPRAGDRLASRRRDELERLLAIFDQGLVAVEPVKRNGHCSASAVSV